MRTDLLRTLATNFGANSVLAAKAIREMYVADPVGFPPAVAELLQSGPELPGTSYLMAILLGEPDWLRTVCDPKSYSLQQSLDLVRRARKLDATTELKLAKMLASLNLDREDDSKFAARVLEVLERSPDPSTALPALRQLSQSRNAHIRSKAALLIGRINRNPQWAEQSETETDPRVAGNAVESLWGLSTPAAREAFFHAALQEHHRISANGMIGLYLMGDETSLPFLFHLSESEKPLGRAAAVWAMGHLEDPRFLPRLSKMMSDPDETIRKGAFKSVGRVRQKMIKMRDAGALRVQLSDVECRGGSHRVRFLVLKDDQLVKGLDARQFVVWNGPAVVEEFSASLREGAAPYYEITYQGPPSATHLVKVQVYSESGVGEDTGFEMAFD
jgi:hypothetical protein